MQPSVAIVPLILKGAVSAVLTVVFRRIGLQDRNDETRSADHTADPVAASAASVAASARARTPAVQSSR